jgi:hypothetical protein
VTTSSTVTSIVTEPVPIPALTPIPVTKTSPAIPQAFSPHSNLPQPSLTSADIPTLFNEEVKPKPDC